MIQQVLMKKKLPPWNEKLVYFIFAVIFVTMQRFKILVHKSSIIIKFLSACLGFFLFLR